ncbi:hypothetical protein WJX72_005643 [[Myrmecia] bisecta]|uniref:Thymidylate kinase n=1 Tax=[Myrmecia] bisecta TaxID=41462 RepID=A0AAW1QQV2_9CHLO
MPPVADFLCRAGPSIPAGVRRGAFIVFEGVDRCGKSTQSKRLVDHLNSHGVDAELWRFPDRQTAIGKMINSYLTSQSEIDDAGVHLLFSANRWEKRDAMLRKLQAGTTLVVDRYSHSGVAFTAAKKVPGLDLDWCKAPEFGLPAPDLVFFLQLSVEAAAARGGYGEERYEKEAFQEEVLRQFLSLRDPTWQVIDASASIEDIESKVQTHATEAISHAAAAQVHAIGGSPRASGAIADPTANTIRRFGWISFWSQLSLSIVSAVILWFAMTNNNGSPSISVYFTLFGCVTSFFSTFLAYGLTRVARRVLDGGKELKAGNVATSLLASTRLNLWGIGGTLVGLQASVGGLLGKTLISATSNPYAAGQQVARSSPAALDIFSVQASTNTILAHFVSIVFATWLLRILNKRSPAASPVP